jgi:hypothetical protein
LRPGSTNQCSMVLVEMRMDRTTVMGTSSCRPPGGGGHGERKRLANSTHKVPKCRSMRGCGGNQQFQARFVLQPCCCSATRPAREG